eukprot:12368095-Alexandrium_andersonii.AAC.1
MTSASDLLFMSLQCSAASLALEATFPHRPTPRVHRETRQVNDVMNQFQGKTATIAAPIHVAGTPKQSAPKQYVQHSSVHRVLGRLVGPCAALIISDSTLACQTLLCAALAIAFKRWLRLSSSQQPDQDGAHWERSLTAISMKAWSLGFNPMPMMPACLM